MTRKSVLVAALWLGFVGASPFLAFGACVLWVKLAIPSDQELQTSFATHQAELETLAKLTVEHHLSYVTDSAFEPTADEAFQTRVRATMKRVGVKRIMAYDKGINFTVAEWGIAVSAIRVGFTYDMKSFPQGPIGERISDRKRRHSSLRVATGWFIYQSN